MLSIRQRYKLVYKIIFHICLVITFCVLLLFTAMSFFIYTGQNYITADDYAVPKKYIRQLTNLEVSINKAELSFKYFIPTLVLKNVTLKSPKNETFVQIEDLLFKIDFLDSISTLQPKIEILDIENIYLKAQRTSGKQKFKLRSIEKILLQSHNLKIQNANLEFYTANSETKITLKLESGHIRNNDNQHQLLLDIDDRQSIILNLTGGGSYFKNMQGNGYIKLSNKNLLSVLNVFDVAINIKNKSLQSKFEFWIKFMPDFNFNYSGIINATLNNAQQKIKVTTHSIGNLKKQDWTASFYNTTVNLSNKEKIKLPNFSIGFNNNIVGLKISEGLQLADIDSIVKQIDIVPESLQTILASMQVKGQIKNLSVSANTDNLFESLKYRFELAQASADDFANFPALKNIAGTIIGSSKYGQLMLNSNDSTIFLTQLYNEKFAVDTVSGLLKWFIDYDNQLWYLSAKNIKVKLATERDQSLLSLDIRQPFNFESLQNKSFAEESLFKLNFSIIGKNIDVATSHKYIPQTLDKATRNTVISTLLSGSYTDVVLVFQQNANTKQRSNFQVLADYKNIKLNYLDDWPHLTNLAGRAYISNNSIFSKIKTGTIANINTTGADITLFPIVANKIDDAIFIKAGLNTDSANALAFMRNTPLREIIGEGIDSFEISGKAEANLELYSSFEETEDIKIVIDSQLTDNIFKIPAAELELNNVAGNLIYRDGLFAKQLTASFDGQPFKAKVTTKRDIKLTFDTKVTTKYLKNYFTDLYFLRQLSGITDLDGEVNIPFHSNDNLTINLNTNLAGIAIDLPLGFNKNSAYLQPFTTNIEFFEKFTEYKIQLVNKLQGRFLIDYDGKMQAATMHIGSVPNYEPQTGIFLVNAMFSEASFDEALDFLDILAPEDVNSSDDDNGMINDLKPLLQIYSSKFEISDDYHLENLSSFITSDASGWVTALEQQDLEGNFKVFYDDSKPIAVDLKYYFKAIDSEQEADSEADPLAEIIPQDLPEMDIKIAELKLGDFNLGSFAGKVRHIDNGVSLTDIKNTYITFEDSASNQLHWTYDKQRHFSSTTFAVSFGNIEPFINFALEMPDVLASSNSNGKGNFMWYGSPLNFNFETLAGGIDFKLKKGSIIEIPPSAQIGSTLMNFIDITSWFKRLKLGFTGIFENGSVFSNLSGGLNFNNGSVSITDPINLKMPSTYVNMRGQADLNQETIEAELDIALPLASSAALLTALVNVPLAIGIFTIKSLFSKTINKLSEVTYTMHGNLADPVIKIKNVRKDPEEAETEDTEVTSNAEKSAVKKQP